MSEEISELENQVKVNIKHETTSQLKEVIDPLAVKAEAFGQKKDSFTRLFLPNLIDKIRYWLWLRKLIQMKNVDMYGGYLDKAFFEVEMADQLSYNEDEDRKYLQSENSKDPVKQDRFGIEQAETRISDAKAIKQEYRRVKSFIDSTQNYINMIRTWKKS